MTNDLALSGYSLGLPTVPRAKIQVRPRVTVQRIQEVVSAYYDISSIHMTGDSRCRSHAHPRQVAMFLCRELMGRSTPDIGKRFGDRDHTTVLHALKAVRGRLGTDGELAEGVETLKVMIQG